MPQMDGLPPKRAIEACMVLIVLTTYIRDRILKVKTTWEGVKKQVKLNVKTPIPTYPDPAWLHGIWCRPRLNSDIFKWINLGIEVTGPNTLRIAWYTSFGEPTIRSWAYSLKVQDGVIKLGTVAKNRAVR